MTTKKLNLEIIEQEMLKRAREIWQVKQDLPFEAFDPLVRLLIGACAVEIKKIDDTLAFSQARILKKLASLMMPRELTGTIPSSTILQVHPENPEMDITPSAQFSGSQQQIEFIFSPAGHYKLIDASIKQCLLLLTNKLVDISSERRIIPSQIASTDEDAFYNSHKRIMFIGLDVNKALASLPNLSFYFNWAEIPEMEQLKYCRLLTATEWYLNGIALNKSQGFFNPDPSYTHADETLKKLTDISTILDNRVKEIYKHHFISILLPEDGENIDALKQNCPPLILDLFQRQKTHFDRPLLWFEVHFPADFPNQALEYQLSHCMINCFPAMNRKLESKVHLVSKNRETIFPISTEEGEFLSIHRIDDSSDNNYHQFQNSANKLSSFYLRDGGVNRLNSQDAIDLLSYLQDVVNDEIEVFQSLQPHELLNDITTLQQIMTNMDKRLSGLGDPIDSNRFVVINSHQTTSKLSRNMTIEYWVTKGAKANGIPHEVINNVYSIDYHMGVRSVKNLTTSKGGHDRLKDSQLLSSYQKELLTRSRIATAADIQTCCFEFLGSAVKKVLIEKGYSCEVDHDSGFLRTVNITIYPSETCRLTDREWDNHLSELFSLLNFRWIGSLPLRISLSNESENAA